MGQRKLPPPTHGPVGRDDPWEHKLVTLTGIALTRRDLARKRLDALQPGSVAAAYADGYWQAYSETFELLRLAVQEGGRL